MVPIIVLVTKTSLIANAPSSNLFHILAQPITGKKKHAVCTLKYLYTARLKRMINSPFFFMKSLRSIRTEIKPRSRYYHKDNSEYCRVQPSIQATSHIKRER